MPDPSAPQGTMKGKSSECPERQLDYIVVEFGGGVIEVMQAVDNQHRRKRAQRADDRPRRQPDQPQRKYNGDLRQQIICEVVTDQPIGNFDQPPGQWRQLVVSELPFAAVSQRLDQV